MEDDEERERALQCFCFEEIIMFIINQKTQRYISDKKAQMCILLMNGHNDIFLIKRQKSIFY
jgi:hypothetical protein